MYYKSSLEHKIYNWKQVATAIWGKLSLIKEQLGLRGLVSYFSLIYQFLAQIVRLYFELKLTLFCTENLVKLKYSLSMLKVFISRWGAILKNVFVLGENNVNTF